MKFSFAKFRFKSFSGGYENGNCVGYRLYSSDVGPDEYFFMVVELLGGLK